MKENPAMYEYKEGKSTIDSKKGKGSERGAEPYIIILKVMKGQYPGWKRITREDKKERDQ